MRRLWVLVAALLLGACTPQEALWTVFHDQRPKAVSVATCESGDGEDWESIDPNAVSPTNDHGMLQINEPTWNQPGHADPVADWIGRHWHLRYDPVWNALMARMIVDKYGWGMWTCE